LGYLYRQIPEIVRETLKKLRDKDSKRRVKAQLTGRECKEALELREEGTSEKVLPNVLEGSSNASPGREGDEDKRGGSSKKILAEGLKEDYLLRDGGEEGKRSS